MKKIIVIILLAALALTGCQNSTTATSESDAAVATRVAQLLTSMPTSTSEAKQPQSSQVVLPTAALTSVVTVTQPAATNTPEPTAAPTEQPTAEATAVPTAEPTAQPTTEAVAGDPRASLGDPTWKDAMDNGDNWPTDVDTAGYTKIDFSGGYMLLTGMKPQDGWRLSFDELTDFYLEMTVKTGVCDAGDRYGLIFRVPDKHAANRGYLFGVTCDGKIGLREWDGRTGVKKMTTHIAWEENDAVNSGADQVNRLGVMADGSKLTLYVNGVKVGEVSDGSYASGYFGVFVNGGTTGSQTISVDELSYWEQ